MDPGFTPETTRRLGRSGLAVFYIPSRTRHVYTRALILFLRSDFLQAEYLVSKSSFLSLSPHSLLSFPTCRFFWFIIFPSLLSKPVELYYRQKNAAWVSTPGLPAQTLDG